jgi:hypothetical protein
MARSTAGRIKKDTKVFYNANGVILVSFWDKGVTPVILIDTLHRIVPLPEINHKCASMLAYNRTKSGVDTFDKRIRGFSCKRKCRRWPYAIFSISLPTTGVLFLMMESRTRKEKKTTIISFLKMWDTSLLTNKSDEGLIKDGLPRKFGVQFLQLVMNSLIQITVKI